MLQRIARKEFVDTWRDGRFRVLAALVAALTIVACLAGWDHHRDVERQHATAREATRAQWLRQPAKNPHAAAHYGLYAFKPTSRLAMVDAGVDPYVGVAAWLEAHKQNEFRYRPAQDATAVQRFGALAVADAVLVILPLVIVLVGFATYAGEREAGTLRQLLGLGVSRRTLLAGKALGLGVALALVLVPAAVVGAVLLTVAPEFGPLGPDLPRAALLTLVYLVALATWLAITIAVSALCRSSRVALIVLLGAWCLNSLLMPRAAADLAGALVRTPSAVEFQSAIERDLGDMSAVRARVEARRAQLLQQYGVDRPEALPVNMSGISLQEGEEHGNEVFDRHHAALASVHGRQESIIRLAGIAAPLLPARSLSMALAGTDFAHHQRFARAAETYRRDLQRLLNGDIARNSRPGQVYLASADLWARAPAFTYTLPSVGWAVAHAGVSVTLLFGWLVAAVLLATWAGLRVGVD